MSFTSDESAAANFMLTIFTHITFAHVLELDLFSLLMLFISS